MISYAQNFEDVMLRRALRDIQRGFYIDLGAFHPEVDNVTRWFYGQGWTGVNVEPNPTFFRLLQEQRPHDINLPFAVADAPGAVRLHLFDGLSTIVEEIGQQHVNEGLSEHAVAEVEAVTLDHIFGAWTGGRTVDFLKVDVEGAEAAVLNACAFRDCRPRILLVEATQPNSTQSSAEAWEPQLLSKGYIFAYFDGLNRFYVRQEDAWRTEHLRVPPNVFDRFLLPLADSRVDLASARRGSDTGMPIGGVPGLLRQRDDLAARIEDMEAQLAAHRAEQARFARLEGRIEQLEAELAAALEDRDRHILEAAQLNLDIRKASRKQGELKLQLEQEQATVSAIRASRSWRIASTISRLALLVRRKRP